MKKQTKIAIVIPARLGSTRFPNKMLEDVGGSTLIEAVFSQCKMVAEKVFVATDSKTILSMFPNESFLTPTDCENGTDRIAWLINTNQLDVDFVINVQGDMVNVPKQGVIDIAKSLLNDRPAVTTLIAKMPAEKQNDPSTVKCVHNGTNAQWFGRGITGYGSWHYGIYGYSREALSLYPSLKTFPEERIESLEQLRWIQNNIVVNTITTKEIAFEINTPEDLETWQQIQSK